MFEVLVIVDGSSDETLHFLKDFSPDYQMRYIYQEHGGLVAARNTGIEHARGDLLYFIDDDVFLEPDFIQRFSEESGDLPRHVQIGNLFNVKSSYTEQLLQLLSDANNDFPSVQKYCEFHPFYEAVKVLYRGKNYCNKATASPAVWWAVISGGNLGIPRSILAETGWFDPAFRGWGPEDADLAYRIFKKGYHAEFHPACRLYHFDHQRDTKKTVQSMIKYAFMLYRKYNKAPEWLEYLKFFNGSISIQEFNNNCATIFNLPEMQIDDFYMRNFMDYKALESEKISGLRDAS